MPFIRKWINSGNVIEAVEYYSIRTPKSIRWPEQIGKRALRGKNRYVTSEQQQKLNNRNSVNHLCRLMNLNFGPDDIFLTQDIREIPVLLTGEIDEEAIIGKKGMMAKCLRKMRTVYRKAGVEFRYIWILEEETEEGPVRPHIHMLVPKLSLDAIVSCWDYGGCCIRALDATRDYKGIADYFSKDPTLGVNHKKRYRMSKNIKQPKVECKRIKRPGGPIKPPKGFKAIIDRSDYVSDITGLIRYVRYVRMDGMDLAGQVIKNSRAGPSPIRIEPKK